MGSLGYVLTGGGIVLYWVLGYYMWKKVDYETFIKKEGSHEKFKEFFCRVQAQDILPSFFVIPFSVVFIIVFSVYCVKKRKASSLSDKINEELSPEID